MGCCKIDRSRCSRNVEIRVLGVTTDHIGFEGRLIALEGEDIVGGVIEDFLSDVDLTAHGVDGDDGAGELGRPGATAASGRGGIGSHHLSMSGGAFGTTAAAPGTNSLGTALSSSEIGTGPMKGPLLGTNPAIDREEAKVDKMIDSICRDC